ncbi:MAG TPA: hypothetical protein VGW74_02255, partial [Propionibacteriaceae bacterium]|nr:hypothetical protein [Propionibacteriaceae bacterium]
MSQAAEAGDAREFAMGPTTVTLGSDGSVTEVRHPRRDHSMLLHEGAAGPEGSMHDAAHRWGKGFAIVDGRGYRFDAPTRQEWRDDGVDLTYPLGPLTLSVQRRVRETWSESYELSNPSTAPVDIGSFAISTPWRDLYGSARDSLQRAVHAHVWAGGADAWVWAVPMDGSGPGLGLILTAGELWAYSVESRDQFTSSNLRGHLYLHLTDRARCAHAMGGQPAVLLPPAAAYRLAWRLDWYDSEADFRASRAPAVRTERLAAQTGKPLEIQLAPGATTDDQLPLVSARPGVRHLDVRHNGRRSRIAVLFHPPLRELAERRADFLLNRQRRPELGDSRRYAFVPYDTRTSLTVLAGGWEDWSDRRERVGSALLLQQLRRRGWGDAAALDEALAGYRRFVVEHVVRSDGTVLDDTSGRRPPRLYNFPWFARFLLDAGEEDLATRVMHRFYALGGEHFLAFELGGVVGDLVEALVASGRAMEADELNEQLRRQAARYLAYGEDLPTHEVNYEQSIAAPLLDLLLAAHRTDPNLVLAEELRRRLRWLTAFVADQPDVRMASVPIRHWDGYWFG